MMATRHLSVWQQVQRVRHMYPNTFDVVRHTHDYVMWEGVVCPYAQEYRVQIVLDITRVPSWIEVTVIEPMLRQRGSKPTDSIPHIYPNKTRPRLPFLCLFDPDAGEWGYHRSVACTIIPWTIDWLGCYEGWLATGEWTGGGRH